MSRRERLLQEATAELALNALVLRDTSNIRWVTDFTGVFDAEPAHLLLATPSRLVLHTDSRYSTTLRHLATGTSIEIDESRVSHATFVSDALAGLQEAHGPIRIGFEDTLTYREHRALTQALAKELGEEGFVLVATSGLVESLRSVKDPNEVSAFERAQEITDAAFSHIVDYMEPDMTERAVQQELDRFMLEAGADGLAFDTIVASGPNGASPHALPRFRRLAQGDAVVMDFGARLDGYCSDMTRTVFIGTPEPEMARAWEALREANESCASMIAPGIKPSQVAAHCERVLERHGFGGSMGHSLGHGVGLDIHEAPALSQSNDRPLVPGNVVTVEPGIYLEGRFGMRLEDFGVVTDAGLRVFTKSTHEMVIIGNR